MEKTLKQRMREDMQLRGFSPRTQETYLMRVTHFARYFRKLPDKLGKKEVREYFLHLVRDKHASYGVLNMTYCALKFIYNAQRIVMRSPLVASPANTLLCRLFAPHKRVSLQGGNEFVGRFKTSGSQFRGDDGL